MDFFKIGIVGAGSSGGILAAHLVKSGHEVFVCDIDLEHLKAAQSPGLEISGIRQMTVEIPNVISDLAEMKAEKIDLLFVALKTPCMESIVPLIKEIFHDEMLVVSFQNGLGNAEFLASHFGERNVARVIINYAGNMIGPGKIKMTFYNGTNFTGAIHPELRPACEKIAKLLSDADLPTEFSEELKVHEWKKAILNCSLSPVSALTGLSMKEVMEGKSTRAIVENTLRECIEVARATGIDFPDDFLGVCMGYLDKAGPHKPSMLIDIENKCETEIGFLNHNVCDLGARHGVKTPYNLMLTALINGVDRCNEIERNR